MLWIRVENSADPDPAFYVNADLDPVPVSGSRDLMTKYSQNSGLDQILYISLDTQETAQTKI